MLLLPSRYATENECAGKHVVTAVGECLLERNNGKIKKIREEVKAENYGGQIRRQEYMSEIGTGMIVVGNQRERRGDCMLPIGMHFGKGRLLRMKAIAMEDISHHLQLVRALVSPTVHNLGCVPREGAGRGTSLWQYPMASAVQCLTSRRSGDAILG